MKNKVEKLKVSTTPSYKAAFDKKGFTKNSYHRNDFTGIAVQIVEVFAGTDGHDYVSYRILGRHIEAEAHKIKPFSVFRRSYSPVSKTESAREGFGFREAAFTEQFDAYYNRVYQAKLAVQKKQLKQLAALRLKNSTDNPTTEVIDKMMDEMILEDFQDTLF